MSLIIFMGLNWVFGVLLFHEYLLPLVYLFAITTALQVCNILLHKLFQFYSSTQGVWIFIVFVVFSQQVIVLN